MKQLSPKTIKIIACAVILLIVTAIILSAFMSKAGKQTTFSEASLKEVVKISELSTVEYTYNSILKVTDEESKTEEVKYYVAYEGKIKAGFDFEKLQLQTDSGNKKYVIIIPEIAIHNTIIDEKTLDFIFTKDKYDTDGTLEEAYSKCKMDLEAKAHEKNALWESARNNAKTTVEALLIPFESQLENGYTFEIKHSEDMK